MTSQYKLRQILSGKVNVKFYYLPVRRLSAEEGREYGFILEDGKTVVRADGTARYEYTTWRGLLLDKWNL